MQASERDETLPRAERVAGVPGVSMRELLDSCAAARVVSTPSAPEPVPPAEGEDVRRPEAA
ncbi:hypothetical protein FPZ41_36620 [Streptomyces sp. K1PN6]|uniref:Uncharacterized protein n=1 Tax=Streptomyces acidicola TaxID=2596892 RepID=A0A5N8X413_9ACTN|nr:hypothetical protein [Streptomyces acidicola]